MATHQGAYHSLKTGGVFAQTPPTIAIGDVDLEIMTEQDVMPYVLRQILPRGVHGEAHVFGQAFKHMTIILGRHLGVRPWLDDTLIQRLVGVGDDEFRIDLQFETKAGAHRAGAIRCVEGERARLDLVQFKRVAVRAATVFGEWLPPRCTAFLLVHVVDDDAAVGETQRGFDGIGKPLAHTIFDHQAVHHDFDGVLTGLRKFDIVGQLAHLAVDQCTGVTVGTQQFEHVHKFTLTTFDHGRKNLESCAFRLGKQGIHDLLRGLRLHQLTAFGAMRYAGTREQQSQIIIDLGDGADRGARITIGGLLIDGHRRRQSFDERLDITALPFGEQSIERQRGFPRAGQAGEHHHTVPGNGQIHILEIMLSRALNGDLQITGDMRDIRYKAAVAFHKRSLRYLPGKKGVAGHHFFNDDFTVPAVATTV